MTRYAIIREEVLQVTYPDRTSAERDMAKMQEAVAGGLRIHYRVEPMDHLCSTCKHATSKPIYVDGEGHGPAWDEEGCMVEDSMSERDWEMCLQGMCPMWEKAEDVEVTPEDFGIEEGSE